MRKLEVDKIGFSGHIFVIIQEENRVTKARMSRKMPMTKTIYPEFGNSSL